MAGPGVGRRLRTAVFKFHGIRVSAKIGGGVCRRTSDWVEDNNRCARAEFSPHFLCKFHNFQSTFRLELKRVKCSRAGKKTRIQLKRFCTGTRPKMFQRKSRIVLTPLLALEIYAQKVNLQRPKSFGSCINKSCLLRGQSAVVAVKYNVSAKTIRDIWNRRTWTFATCRLWKQECSLYTHYSPDQVVSFKFHKVESYLRN